MNIKAVENTITVVGVSLLLFMTFVGVLMVFDAAFGWDLMNYQMKQASGMLLGIVVMFIASSMFISVILNISRIANAVERIADEKSQPNQ